MSKTKCYQMKPIVTNRFLKNQMLPNETNCNQTKPKKADIEIVKDIDKVKGIDVSRR